MKVLKYFFISLIALLFLFVATLLTLLIVVKPNDYKPQIQQFVQEAIGRELVIQGNIELSVFPWLGLELGEVRLKNTEGFLNSDFAVLEAVDIRVAILPLIKTREIQIGMVSLKGLQLNLARQVDGVSNWDDLVSGSAEESSPVTEEKTTESIPQLPLLFVIGGVHIENANIRWQDEQTGTSAAIEKLNLKTGRIELGKPIDFNLDFSARNQSPELSATVKLVSRLSADLGAQMYVLNPLEIETDIRSKDLPLTHQQIRFNGEEIKANLATQHYQIRNVKLAVDAEGTDLPKGRQSITMDFTAEADLEKQTAQIQSLLLKTLGVSLELNAQAKNILAEPDANGHIKIQPFSPKKILKEWGNDLPITADAAVLEHFSGSMAFSKAGQQASVTNVDLKLDDTHITGSADVLNLSQHAAFDIQIQLDDIDADRYLPPVPENSKPEQNTETVTTGDESIELPLELMRSLDAKGLFKIGRLKIMKLKVQNLEAGLNAKDGLIALKPMNLDLYQGQFRGDVLINAQTETPHYAMNMQLTNIESSPLLDDFMGDSLIEGRVNFASQLTVAGDTVNKLKQKLNGDVEFAFQNGALKGINLAEKLREAQAKLRREPYQKQGAKKTDFAALTGAMAIQNGLATFKNVKIEAPALRAGIEKTANLATEQLDLRVDLHVVGTKTGQSGKNLDETRDLYVPIDITGPFTAPKIDINEKEMFKAWQMGKQQKRVEEKSHAIEQKKQEEIQQIQEKVEERKEDIKDKLKKKLKLQS